MNINLTYIYNSGFVLESKNETLIFDFYRDSQGGESADYVHNRALRNNGCIYVFCTHSHYDHFNKEILKWKKLRPDIIYIFSKEILDNHKAKPEDAIYLDKFETYQDQNLRVKAYGSTDIGGSFLIKWHDKTIFHAGDLNNWHWNEESTADEVKKAESMYHRELNLLAKDVKHINLAMFPLDPRLGKDYMLGAKEFVKTIKVDVISPMHFREHTEDIPPFALFAQEYGCECICWKHEGETIKIDL